MENKGWLVVALLAVVFIIVAIGISFNILPLTGYVTTTGTVNVSVDTLASVNFTVNNLNFGSGAVTAGQDAAYLYSNGTVTGGTWTPDTVTSGFLVENIGNVNTTLNISFSDTAATMIGGNSPALQYKVTDKSGETGACDVGASGFTLGEYTDALTAQTRICDVFNNAAALDEISIDIYIKIPSDSYTDARGNVVTVTYEGI